VGLCFGRSAYGRFYRTGDGGTGGRPAVARSKVELPGPPRPPRWPA